MTTLFTRMFGRARKPRHTPPAFYMPRPPVLAPDDRERRRLANHARMLLLMIDEGRARDAATAAVYLDAAASFIAEARKVPTPLPSEIKLT